MGAIVLLQDFLVAPIKDGVAKRDGVWIATAGVGPLCGFVKTFLVFREIPNMGRVGRRTAFDEAMAIDFEIRGDEFALDFHDSRVLGSARFRGGRLFRWLLMKLADDFIFGRLDGFDNFSYACVVHPSKRRPVYGLIRPRQRFTHDHRRVRTPLRVRLLVRQGN